MEELRESQEQFLFLLIICGSLFLLLHGPKTLIDTFDLKNIYVHMLLLLHVGSSIISLQPGLKPYLEKACTV